MLTPQFWKEDDDANDVAFSRNLDDWDDLAVVLGTFEGDADFFGGEGDGQDVNGGHQDDEDEEGRGEEDEDVEEDDDDVDEDPANGNKHRESACAILPLLLAAVNMPT